MSAPAATANRCSSAAAKHRVQGQMIVTSSHPTKAGAFAAGGEDRQVRVYDAVDEHAPLACSATFDRVGDDISALCWDANRPDALYAAAGSRLFAYDTSSASAPVFSSNFATDEINALVAHASRALLFAADDDGTIYLVSTPECRMLRALRRAHASVCGTLALRASPSLDLVSGGFDRRLCVWNSASGVLRLSAEAGIGGEEGLRLVISGNNSSSSSGIGSKIAGSASARSNARNNKKTATQQQQQQLTASAPVPSTPGQFVNPPFVHCVAWHPSLSVVAAGFGNGAIALVCVRDNDNADVTPAVIAPPKVSPSAKGGKSAGVLRNNSGQRQVDGAAVSSSVLLTISDAHAAAATSVGFIPIPLASLQEAKRRITASVPSGPTPPPPSDHLVSQPLIAPASPVPIDLASSECTASSSAGPIVIDTAATAAESRAAASSRAAPAAQSTGSGSVSTPSKSGTSGSGGNTTPPSENALSCSVVPSSLDNSRLCLFSAGDDGFIRLWDVQDVLQNLPAAVAATAASFIVKYAAAAEAVDSNAVVGGDTAPKSPAVAAAETETADRRVCSIAHGRGPNCVSVLLNAAGEGRLLVCDTSSQLAVYSFSESGK